MVAISKGPGSKQDYQTPQDFIKAYQDNFGPIVFDLAASSYNTQSKRYFAAPDSGDLAAEALDSLSQNWTELAHRLSPGTLWLNPPFKNIAPWAKKCSEESKTLPEGFTIALLITAAPGSNYFKQFIYPYSLTYFLNGRLCFDGKDPFPKDCSLSLFGPAHDTFTMDIWDWKS